MIETMIGNSIANQCSPVLMDVKPSNLLILTREEEEGFLEMEDIPGIPSAVPDLTSSRVFA